MLGRKQSSTHEDFVHALQHIEQLVSRQQIDGLIDRTASEIRQRVRGRNAAFAWSGGKDSQALELVCRVAGVPECVLVISDLEYPEFLRWTTAHMPPRLEVVSTGQDLDWLAAHQDWLFPVTSAQAARWFKAVQHTGQGRYYRQRGLDVLLLGRRTADGNHVGPGGEYTSDGICRYSPIREWRHEDVLAACHYYRLPWAPCYRWPRGFRVGTGPWPARQWCGSTAQGFAEVWAIDPSIVRTACPQLPAARRWCEETGHR